MSLGRRSTRLLSLFLALSALALVGACSSSDDSGDTFTVNAPGDRIEVDLGVVPAGEFHFEARGFESERQASITDGQRIFFWLYDGNFDFNTSGFLYKTIQYIRQNYYCYGGKVKGYQGGNGHMFGEACFSVDWDKSKWYSFDIVWDGATITLFIDGVAHYSCTYGSNTLPLFAGLGWPPAGGENPGTIGMEYRNWKLTRR
jgi:hypothetical protein